MSLACSVDRNKAMEETDTGSDIHADIHEGNVEGRIDVTKGVPVIHFKGATLAPASFGSVIAVFLSMIFSMIAMLCGKLYFVTNLFYSLW